MSVEFLHAMVRVTDIDAALKFYGEGLGLKELMRYDSEEGRFTLVFLASPDDIERCGGVPGERNRDIVAPLCYGRFVEGRRAGREDLSICSGAGRTTSH